MSITLYKVSASNVGLRVRVFSNITEKKSVYIINATTFTQRLPKEMLGEIHGGPLQNSFVVYTIDKNQVETLCKEVQERALLARKFKIKNMRKEIVCLYKPVEWLIT